MDEATGSPKPTSRLKRFFGAIAFVAIPSLVYGFYFEPEWIEVTHHVRTAKISKKVRIAHLTDLHVRSIRRREMKLLRLLAAENPDLIVITGDSVSDNENYEPVDEFLTQLRAPLGIWVIKGNWERWHPRKANQPRPIEGGLHFIDNAGAQLEPDLGLFGYVDGMNELDKAGPPPKWNPGTYRIGLLHSPEDFDRIAPDFDLVFAGHTHGGQIRIPFLPPIFLPHGSGKYLAGWYRAANAEMYVSRGIGNSLIEARFFCRPELAIIDLVPAMER